MLMFVILMDNMNLGKTNKNY